MTKILIFSDLFLPTFPFLEIPLYNELSERAEVLYVLQEGDVRLTTPDLYKKFSKLNLYTIKNAKGIDRLVGENDVFVSRFCYKGFGSEVASRARKAKAKVFMYDPSGIDIRVRAAPAHFLTAKSKSLKLATLKKFPKVYRNIFTTGTVHYDAAATTDISKEKFMKKYSLDTRKNLAILTPANPGELGHQQGVNNEYKEIIRIVKEECSNWEILVKAHPLDYTASMPAQPGIVHKNEHYKGKHSWESFAPGIQVVKAHEGYEAISACDVVLNVRSSIAMETPLFPKPLLNINREQYTTNWPFQEGVMMDVCMSELSTILNTHSYSVDPKKCKEYVKENCYSDDGKAYLRTANAIMKVFRGEI